jgi:isoleucyl-tRNA synthetase
VLLDVEMEMEQYRFFRAWQKLYAFCVNELSSVYFSIHKDTLYCAHPESVERLSVQFALHEILETLVRMFSPFLPFTCAEVWQEMNKDKKETPLIFETLWPILAPIPDGKAVLARFERWFSIREDFLKKIETLIVQKEIRNFNQATVIVKVPDEKEWETLETFKDDLRRFLIVAEIRILKSSEEPSPQNRSEIVIDVFRKDGVKCDRCWVTFERPVQAEERHPSLCLSCVDIVEKKKN